MILIGIINMGSALLVLILIRTNFIGIMKAIGASNWSIRKIFLIQSGFLIGKGIIWGNIIGLGLGPFSVGFFSDIFSPEYGLDGLRYALMTSLVVILWGSFHYYRTGVLLKRSVS